ncbi:MAG: hypothetical protein K2X32_01710, partial [Phycisphaerales bacterium]|nr:hypothetical protein [Phycisphaerales bacterium]
MTEVITHPEIPGNTGDAGKGWTERHLYDGVRRIQTILTEWRTDDARPVPTVTNSWQTLHREYIYGTDDGFVGVDELLVTYAPPPGSRPDGSVEADRTVAWLTLQDGGGDIVALVKTTPNTGGGGGGGG